MDAPPPIIETYPRLSANRLTAEASFLARKKPEGVTAVSK